MTTQPSPTSHPLPHTVDAIILGAGPAGLFCAREAAARGVRVLVVDKQDRAGRKLSMAGGGMGNFTNRNLGPEHYVGENPAFTRSALRSFNTDAVLSLLDELDIPWEEREFGQIFGLQPAATFTEKLQQQARDLGVIFRFGEKPKITHHADLFQLRLDHDTFTAHQLVLATGSPAWPQCGADDSGASLAARWGHRLIPFRPALAPFIMPRDWPLHGLEGISLNARISIVPSSSTTPSSSADPWPMRPLLFTHKGLSGPAALVASCFYQPGDALRIDFLPQHSLLELLHQPENGKLLFRNFLSRLLPNRLAELLIPPTLAARKCAELSKADRQALATAVHAHDVTPTGTETMRKAEAASGGIATADLSRSLQSLIIPRLFFCGEILDVTGLLGGYNIHWALASARVVGRELRVGGALPLQTSPQGA